MMWYCNVNDLIGGYCIGTVEGPLSSNRLGADIADFLTKENARELVRLHNSQPRLRAALDDFYQCIDVEEFADLQPESQRVATDNHELLWHLGESVLPSPDE